MGMRKTISIVALSVFFTLTLSAQNFINHRGQDIFVSGINVAWMKYGNDLTMFDEEEWTSICDNVRNAGGNTLRWWIHVDGRSTPTYDSKTDTVIGISETALNNLELAMDIAATKGIVVSLCLWAHGMVCTDDGDAGTKQAIDRVRRNKLLLTDSVATQRYIDNALIPMVTRLKNHTAILCWEIFNEPEGMTSYAGWKNFDYVTLTDVQRFVNMCAGAIHRTDPNAKVSNGNWTILTIAKYDSGQNYFSDEALYNVGHDKDGYLDFYMFHYYPAERGADYSPFHRDYNTFYAKETDKKPVIIGEFPAYGMIAQKGKIFQPGRQNQKTTTESMQWLYDNGFSGGLGWTYTNHDGNGGLPDMEEALGLLQEKYPEHIIIQHDPSFNYIPQVKKRIADTVLFKNAAKVEAYINANDYFTDDANDQLTYTISSKGVVTAEITEDGTISFTAKTDTTGHGVIVVTATDKGGKFISQTFTVLVREQANTNANKLLNAFVTYSSVEDDQYLPYYANDGIDTTRWSSEYNDDEFICFDMLQEENIRRIVLNWEWNAVESKGAYADAYTIETSKDGKSWETVFTVKQGQIIKSNIVLRKDDEDPIVCRYIKINFTKRATSWGYSLTEVQAYDFDDHANNGARIKAAKKSVFQAARINEPFDYQILRTMFTDENYDVLTITAIDESLNCPCLPKWLSFDPYTYYLTGTPSAADTGSHYITIAATDFFGISNSFEFEIYVIPDKTDIQTVQNPLNIYPNPCAIDSFTLELPNAEGKALVSFTNTDGKLAAIKYATFNGGRATCMRSGLTTGTYAITIRLNNETYKSKIVIE